MSNTTLSCMSCGQVMHKRTRAGVDYEHCYGCGSHWFDGGELEAVLQHEGLTFEQSAAARELRLPQTCRHCHYTNPPGVDPCSECGTSLSMPCPRGHGEMYVVHEGKTELDYCTTCQGLWLDANELKGLREALEDTQDWSGSPPTDMTARCHICGQQDTKTVADVRGIVRCPPCMEAYMGIGSAQTLEREAAFRAEWQAKLGKQRTARQAVDALDSVTMVHSRGFWSRFFMSF